MARLIVAVLLAGVLGAPARAAEQPYPCRWVYVSRGLHADRDVEEVREIVRTAAAHGLNGMVLSAGLDRLDVQPPDYFARLDAVKTACREQGVEIIPIIFSAGYGGSVLAQDPNLAAGIPVADALFVVKGAEARLEADPPVQIVNSGFEDYAGHRLKGFNFHDKPGEISFVDTDVHAEGKASLRFQDLHKDPHGHGRVMQEVAVRPHRCYRVTCRLKTEGLQGNVLIQVLAGDRYIAPSQPNIPATADWTKVTSAFNSLAYDKVRIYAGVWGGQAGRLWVDDLRIEEVGLANVLRRPGTPLVVRDEKTGEVYAEGRDYAPVSDPKPSGRFDREGPPLRLLPGGRIADGQRLRVSYYHSMAINRGQVSVCLSEPKLYDLWRREAELLHRHLAPNRVLLSMDEIREGGSCQACKARGLTMAEILGDCITRQVRILRDVNPAVEVFIWSDMLDPNHNAHGDYFLVEGDFSGSWKHVPKDLVIVCWYYRVRRESLDHFSRLGFKTLAGAYYDGDTLENPAGWLEALHQTPGALGIMYTTWQNKYALLGPFGDLVSRP